MHVSARLRDRAKGALASAGEPQGEAPAVPFGWGFLCNPNVLSNKLSRRPGVCRTSRIQAAWGRPFLSDAPNLYRRDNKIETAPATRLKRSGLWQPGEEESPWAALSGCWRTEATNGKA